MTYETLLLPGFPTLLYFKDGQMKFQYEGGNNKQVNIKMLREL